MNSRSSGRRRISLVVMLALAFGGWMAVAPEAVAGTTPLSGLSPYPDGGDPTDVLAVTDCNGGAQIGIVYRNSETEPHLAVNPTDPDNMIAVWHQDRWSNGSAQGIGGAYTLDGGATWSALNVSFTRCSGGLPGTTGDYQRASDPWLTFGPAGVVYLMALVSDQSTSRNGMVVAKSTDGGVSFSDPIIIKDHDAAGIKARSLFHDKNTMTADPHHPGFVYATWTLFRNRSYALLFSRSTDGGDTWSPAHPVNVFEKMAMHEGASFRQGAQIAVLPDGTLINTFFRVLADPRRGGQFTGIEEAIFRSRDQGGRWERLDTPVAAIVPTGAIDAELFFNFGIILPVRDAGQLPDIAVNRTTGAIYIVWQDGRFSPLGASSILIARSIDGGDTWSQPLPVHDVSNPFNQAFLPAVAVATDGTVGVLFYDFRNDQFGDAILGTDVHLTKLDPDLNIQTEIRLTDSPFDMRQMLITGFSGFFPGDYIGLDTAGNDFVAAFTVANNLGLDLEFPQEEGVLRVDANNRQDIVFTRVSGP